jgi:hypothetical protein
MPRKVKRMTPNMLKRMIVQEARRLRTEVLETGKDEPKKVADATPEVEADEYADSIEQDIDWMKALKIHERRLARKLREVRTAKKRIGHRLTKKI